MISPDQKLSVLLRTANCSLKYRKTLLIILITLTNFIFNINDCFPQQGWFWLNTHSYGSTYSSGFSLDQNINYLGNSEGILFVTYNYGGSLYPIYTGTALHLSSVYFLNQLTGYVCGWYMDINSSQNLLMKTSTGGLVWTNLHESTSNNSLSVFINAQTGFLTDATSLLKTTNGGSNWTEVKHVNGYYYSLQFINDVTGFASYADGFNGTSNIIKTTNQGANWNSIYSRPMSNIFVYPVRFFDSNTGIAAGATGTAGFIDRTTNGGVNWNSVCSYASGKFMSLSITDSLAVATGYNGAVYISHDYGLNWQALNIGSTELIYYSKFKNANTGFIAGQNGLIKKTTNGGANWITNQPFISSNIRSSCFLNNKTGFAVSDSGKVIITKNGGIDWYYKNINTEYPLVSVSFINENLGIAGSSHGQIFKTTNGGTNWITAWSAGSPAHYVLKMFDSVRFSSVDESCTLMKTYNGGVNFVTYDIPLMWLTGGYIRDSLNYYAVDYLGGFTKSTNGGLNWSGNASVTNKIPSGVFFTDNNNGYIIANSGTALKTTNGGSNWYQMNINSSYDLNYVFFTDQSTGYICGDYGLIKKTTNAGLSWYSQLSTSGSNLNNIIFPCRDTGYMFGENGTILKTITCGDIIGIKTINSSAPSSFSLYQNYPNPFNPSTKIKFDVKDEGFVSLKVYDITGKEIAALVNERLKPGSYEALFNVLDYERKALSSGIYFYSLTAGNFRETKKMILIK